MMAKTTRNNFFDAVLKRKFGLSTCFLCGCRLGRKNRADEHVIPKWIQRKYKLANQQLYLLNGTTIPYRQLTIPCCFTCNNKHLQPLEKRMSLAVAKGVAAVRAFDRHELFLWLGKMFYGLLYRELFLPWDRAGNTNAKITSKTLLKLYEMHHLFLQSIRVPMRFIDFCPASILIVSTQEPDDIRLCWDFRDELKTICIACRMGTVGIVGVLQDGEAQRSLFPLMKLQRRKLHPIQFTEVFAQVSYKAMLFNRTPKYIIAEGDPKTVIQMPLGGLSGKPLYNDWNPYHYAKILCQITGIPMKHLFHSPDQVMTWLRNPDGTAKSLPIKRYPIQLPQ
jgi:hypothetical protein